MKAYGSEWRQSSAYSGIAPRSTWQRFPSGQSISGPVSAAWWRRLITYVAGH